MSLNMDTFHDVNHFSCYGCRLCDGKPAVTSVQNQFYQFYQRYSLCKTVLCFSSHTKYRNYIDMFFFISCHYGTCQNQNGAYKASAAPHFGMSDHISVELIPTYTTLNCRTKPTTRTIQVWTEEATSALQECF